MRHVDAGTRRTRLARLHLLTGRRAADAVTAARSVVAFAAWDTATVYLSGTARTGAADPGDLDRAMNEAGTLVRTTGPRGIPVVAPTDLLPVLLAVGEDNDRPRSQLADIAAGQLGWSESTFDGLERDALALLRERGTITAADLAAAVPPLRKQVVYGTGTRAATIEGVAGRLLAALAAQGRVLRRTVAGRDMWSPAPDMPRIPHADARTALTRAWLDRFGPATSADLRWWSGWSTEDVRRALAGCGAVRVDLDGSQGYLLPGPDPEPDPDPAVTLLPALDPTPMGWRRRDFFLPPEHRADVSDRSGGIGPTIWYDGRIVGVWAQRPDGGIGWTVFDPSDRTLGDEIELATKTLSGWLGDARIPARVVTPLHRRLATV
jgi:hypothetical protein